MNATAVLSLVLVLWVTYTSCLPFSGSCDSCGRECQSVCGTRGFRTCCLNYLKKRSTPMSAAEPEASLRVVVVFPEIAQYYSRAGLLIPPGMSDHNQMRVLFRKPENDKSDDSEDAGPD